MFTSRDATLLALCRDAHLLPEEAATAVRGWLGADPSVMLLARGSSRDLVRKTVGCSPHGTLPSVLGFPRACFHSSETVCPCFEK